MFCSKCGTSNADDAVFCSKCGAKLQSNAIEVDNLESAQVSKAAKGEKKTEPCKQCGTLLPKKAKKCPQCGAKHTRPVYMRGWFKFLCAILAIILVVVLALAIWGFITTRPYMATYNALGAKEQEFLDDNVEFLAWYYGNPDNMSVVGIWKDGSEYVIAVKFEGHIDRIAAKRNVSGNMTYHNTSNFYDIIEMPNASDYELAGINKAIRNYN